MRRREKKNHKGLKVDMTCAKPAFVIIKFSLPIVVGLIFTQLYNMTDATLAGYIVGESSVAVIGACSALYVLLFGFVMTLNQGYSIVVARLFGDKSIRMIKKASAIIFGYNVVGALLFTVCGIVLTRPVLTLLKTPTDLINSSTIYLSVVITGIGFCTFYYMFASVIMALGNSRAPLFFLLFGLVCNVGFSFLFMGVLSLGVLGAALGTVTAQVVMAVMICLYSVKNYRQYFGFLYGFSVFRSPLAREIFLSGISMALINSMIALGTVMTQPAINRLGENYVAGYSVARRIFVLFSQPFIALSIAMSTFVGQNFGANKKRRIKCGIKTALIISLILGALIFFIMYLLGRDFSTLLSGQSDAEVADLAGDVVLLTAPFLMFFGFMVVLKTSLQAMQYRKITLSVSLAELSLRCLALIFFAEALGFIGIAAIEPVLWVLVSVILFIYNNIPLSRISLKK